MKNATKTSATPRPAAIRDLALEEVDAVSGAGYRPKVSSKQPAPRIPHG